MCQVKTETLSALIPDMKKPRTWRGLSGVRCRNEDQAVT